MSGSRIFGGRENTGTKMNAASYNLSKSKTIKMDVIKFKSKQKDSPIVIDQGKDWVLILKEDSKK